MPLDWSVRITPKNYTLDQVVSDLSGVTCVIVKHTWSYRTRKDCEQHIHIFWRSSKDYTKETFNEKVVKKLFPKLDGRHAEYSTSDPGSLETFLDYTLRDSRRYKKRGASLLYWNIPESQPDWISELIDNPLYDLPVEKINVVSQSPLDAFRGRGIEVKKNTTEDKKQKFYNYVKEYVLLKPEKVLTKEKIRKLLFSYSRGGFPPTKINEFVNFAMYNYLLDSGDKVRFKSYRDAWISAAAKYDFDF